MRFAALLSLWMLLPAAALAAEEFGRTLRELRVDDRERRREALEAFADGRVRPEGSAQADKLASALRRIQGGKHPGIERALAVRALGRLKRVKDFRAILEGLERETDDRVLHEAARTFRSAPADLLPDLLRRLERSKDPLRRAVLVRLMGEMRDDESRRRTRLRASIADHWCPRAAAAHALGHDRNAAALPPLVALLDSSDPGLLTAAFESLTRLTGLKHGRDVVEWKTWWAQRDPAAPLSEPKAPDKKPGARRRYAHEVTDEPIRPYYFGIPVRGTKVVFVFDVSASMRYKLPLAYDQLSRAVKGLPSTSRFEVIFFNEHVWPWRGRLSHADPVTKELLVRHLATIEIKSYTNLFDSIEQGLAMKPDELFVISDGQPNRGRWRLPRDILREVGKRNVRKVPIHTISVVRVVDGDEHVSLLKAIAAASGGQSVQRTLK